MTKLDPSNISAETRRINSHLFDPFRPVGAENAQKPPVAASGAGSATMPQGAPDAQKQATARDTAAPNPWEYDWSEPDNAYPGPEKHLHSLFTTDMQRRGIHCIHARTDCRSTIDNGLPDFHLGYTAPDGITRMCAVEFKAAAGRLKPKQRECITEMRREKRIPVIVAWSLAEAIQFACAQLNWNQPNILSTTSP